MERPPVVEDPFHRGVVDEEEVSLPAEIADELPVGLVERASRRHRGAHEQQGRGSIAHGGGERVPVEPPLALGHPERHGSRRPAGEVDAVDEAGVGRIGDDHLVAGVDRHQKRVEDAFEASAGDHDLALRVVGVARASGEEGGDRLAQLHVAGEREPAVRLRRLQAPGRDADRLRRQRQVGVEVLHAQHRPFGACARRLLDRRGDPVDPESADRLESLRPLDHGTSLDTRPSVQSGRPGRVAA